MRPGKGDYRLEANGVRRIEKGEEGERLSCKWHEAGETLQSGGALPWSRGRAKEGSEENWGSGRRRGMGRTCFGVAGSG